MTSDSAEYSPLDAGLRGDLAPVLVDWEREELMRLRATLKRAELVFDMVAQHAMPEYATTREDALALLALVRGMGAGGAGYLHNTRETTERIQRLQADAKVEAFEREALSAAAGETGETAHGPYAHVLETLETMRAAVRIIELDPQEAARRAQFLAGLIDGLRRYLGVPTSELAKSYGDAAEIVDPLPKGPDA